VTTPAQNERNALCDLFLAVGPDAPTLSGEWTTRDLAAHLVVREGRPDAAVGIVVKPLSGYSENVRRGAAESDWPSLVERVRSGPPRWSPMRFDPIDRATNTIEFFVHHEDVRRAQAEWEPRLLDRGLEHDLLGSLRRAARLLAMRAPAPFSLVTPDGTRVVAKKGDGEATVHGPVGELVLFIYGRQTHARVDITAPDGVAEALRAARFGI
jgi:uncharacterized protein (TIGR03085 family)